jgi:opacity protein-like surface antigen
MKSIITFIFCIVLLTNIKAQINSEIITENQESPSFVTVQISGVNSIGHFKENWDSGTAVYIGHGSISDNNWALMLHTGYISLEPNPAGNYSSDSKITIIPLMVGARYYILRQNFRPFVLANSGVNIIIEKSTLDEVPVDITKVRTHFQVGAGMSLQVVRQIEIEVAAKYNSHLLEPSIPYNFTGVEYGIALNWLLK